MGERELLIVDVRDPENGSIDDDTHTRRRRRQVRDDGYNHTRHHTAWWFPYPAIVVGLVVCGLGVVRTLESKGGAQGLSAYSLGYNNKANETSVELTVRQYQGDVHVLSWHHGEGFGLKSSKRGELYAEDDVLDGNRAGRKAGRMGGPVDLIRNTISKYYPERMTNGSAPFEIVFVVTDLPATPCANPEYAKKNCNFERWVPIYSFGSAPKDENLFPTLVPSTLGVLGKCFEPGMKAKHLRDDEPFCDFLRFPTQKYSASQDCEKIADVVKAECRYHGLFSIDDVDDKSEYEWDNLKPQMIWRGSDYKFLGEDYGGFKPDAEVLITKIERASNVTNAIMSHIQDDDIGPRARAVLMSKLKPDLIDARFFNWGSRGEERAAASKKLGFDSYDHLDERDLGKYKYHIDLGGGGGTTWSGVIPKLSMPGVLFHHETATKDSYFDLLKPWEHYIPVLQDLSDLEEKIEWAEQHQDTAKRISMNADEWVRDFRRLTSLLRHNYDKLASPLRSVLGADDLIPFELAHVDLILPSANDQAVM